MIYIVIPIASSSNTFYKAQQTQRISYLDQSLYKPHRKQRNIDIEQTTYHKALINKTKTSTY